MATVFSSKGQVSSSVSSYQLSEGEISPEIEMHTKKDVAAMNIKVITKPRSKPAAHPPPPPPSPPRMPGAPQQKNYQMPTPNHWIPAAMRTPYGKKVAASPDLSVAILWNYPYTAITNTAEIRMFGHFRVDMRPIVPSNAWEPSSVAALWKRLLPSCQLNPWDLWVVDNSVCICFFGTPNPMSFVAEVHYEMLDGTRMDFLCGALLATKMTLHDFLYSLQIPQNPDFPEQWNICRSLFQPALLTMWNRFQNWGSALFINAFLVEPCLTMANTLGVRRDIYGKMFEMAMQRTQKQGTRFAIYLAKNYEEVDVFQKMGFKIESATRFKNGYQLTLLVWEPPTKGSK